jgi:hypothetical protein
LCKNIKYRLAKVDNYSEMGLNYNVTQNKKTESVATVIFKALEKTSNP